MKLVLTSTLIASALTLAAFGNAAQTQGRPVVYCSATNEICETEAKAFGGKYDVKTLSIRSGSDSMPVEVGAEKKNPQVDAWYGGTLDPQSQAGEMGLLQPYKSSNLEQITEKFRDPAKVEGNLSSAVHVGILGFGANIQRLKEKNLPVPECWEDLTRPGYKDEIQIVDPQSSGTAYIALATFVQLWGGDQASDYLKQLSASVSQYTRSGIAPTRNAARGEMAIGIGFLHDYSLEKEQGTPLELISPCEGTGYEIGGVSILKGARSADNARLFVCLSYASPSLRD